MGIRTRIIIDFDGTLTAEERQATRLGGRSLDTLADILAPATGQERDHLRQSLETAYRAARREILAHSELGGWEVSGLLASYGDEGAFILNTSAIQLLLASLLRRHPAAVDALEAALPAREYGLVEDTSNYLFHRHTAEFPPLFRPEAREVLVALLEREDCEPVVLTNSLGDKVERLLATLDLPHPLRILGDTRQYEMVEDRSPRSTPTRTAGPVPPWQPLAVERRRRAPDRPAPPGLLPGARRGRAGRGVPRRGGRHAVAPGGAAHGHGHPILPPPHAVHARLGPTRGGPPPLRPRPRPPPRSPRRRGLCVATRPQQQDQVRRRSTLDLHAAACYDGHSQVARPPRPSAAHHLCPFRAPRGSEPHARLVPSRSTTSSRDERRWLARQVSPCPLRPERRPRPRRDGALGPVW